MRAVLNNTMDVYYGPSSPYGPPGTRYVTAAPCRVVPQSEITQVDFPLSLSASWLTHDNPPHLNGPKYTSQYLGQWNADISTCDRVAIPTGSAQSHAVVRVEDVAPFGETAYSRCLLIPLSSIAVPPWFAPSPPVPLPPPPPSPPPPPGDSCITAPLLSLDTDYSYSSDVAHQQWLEFTLASGATTFTVTASKPSAVGSEINLWVNSCAALSLVSAGYSFISFVVTPFGSRGMWVEMPADPSWGPEPWTIRVTSP